MNTFITFCIFLLLTYCTISWILPKLLAWLFQRKYNVILKIGRIGIPYLRLCDVLILKNGISVHVDEISFRSSFLNSEVTKLVTLVVRDVRINKDIGDKKILKKNGSFTMESTNPVDFRNKKIPPFITTFAQFMAIHVYNISAMFLRADTCLIHATAAELHMDGSVLQNARTLLVNTNLSEARVKVLRHADNKNEDETCLGELSFAISMEATLVAQGPLSVEKLHLGMSQTSAVINEGFYGFVQERRLKNKSENVSSNKMPNIYHRIAPIIPKNFTFNVESTSLRSLKNNTRTDFVSTIQNFIVNIRFNAQTSLNIDGYENLPQVFLAFQISNFNIRSSKEVFLVLNTLTLDAKMENNIVNLLLKLNTLSICYNHVLIHNWITSNFLQNKCIKTTQIEQDLNQKCEDGFLEKIISQCIINGCAELWHISVLLRLSEQEETNASIGFDHTKLILNQAFETRGFAYNSYIPKVLLGNRHWTVELLVEALWCHLSIHEPDTSILKKQHPWGTPLFLGVALVKVGSHGSRDTKMDSMLDSLQAEWSPNLAKFILLALVCLNEYHIPKSTSIKTTPKLIKTESHKFHIHINLTNFNCFFITTNNVYIVARLNSTTVDKTTHKTYMKISDFKLTSLEPNKSYYTCVRAEEIKTFCCYINLARLDGKRNSNINELKIQCQNEVFFNWSTNLHLKVLTLLNEIKEFRESVSDLIKIPSKIKDEGKPKKDVTVELFGNVALFIKISENHNMNVTVDRIVIQSTNETFSIENITTLISIDNANIFTIEGLKLNRIHDNKEVKEERYTCEDFVLPWNKTWGLNVNLLRARFPYVHCYAEAIQNEFISVFKWLKIVHKKTKVPFTVDSPLPSDLLINVRTKFYNILHVLTSTFMKIL